MTDRDFKDRVRSFSSLNIVFFAMLAFAPGCIGIGAVLNDPPGLVVAAIGTVAAFGPMGLVGYLTVCKSDLLRVERESITVRWIDRV